MASRRLALLVSMLALAIAALVPATASAWAPASSATIHPGVQTFTQGAQCTANFIFQNGSDVYIGQAAHCSGTGAATETDGCLAQSLPLGTPVEIDGASRPGVARLQLLADDAGQRRDPMTTPAPTTTSRWSGSTRPTSRNVNPSVPGYGGPTGVGEPGGTGADVYSYGNSSLRFGITPAQPEAGHSSCERRPSGWSHTVYTVTPGIPGDSGSGFLSSTGSGLRHAEHGCDRAAARLQRRQRPQQRARLRAGQQLVHGRLPRPRHRAVHGRHRRGDPRRLISRDRRRRAQQAGPPPSLSRRSAQAVQDLVDDPVGVRVPLAAHVVDRPRRKAPQRLAHLPRGRRAGWRP